MKTRQTIVAVVLSSLTFVGGASFAGGFPGNPERDVIDQTTGTSFASASPNDGWKDVGGEHGDMYVGTPVIVAGGDAHAYSKEEMMQARVDYREAN